MSMKKYQLGEFEELVLLTVGVLYGEAYGVAIKDEIEVKHNRKVSVGALQSALRRMEEKGFLLSELGESTKARGGKRKRFQPFSLQPTALRDVALIVPETTSAGDVLKDLAKFAREATPKTFALEEVTLFDVYTGKGLPEGTKSLAYSLKFRAADRTLTDEEVNQVFTALLEKIAAKTSHEIRR